MGNWMTSSKKLRTWGISLIGACASVSIMSCGSSTSIPGTYSVSAIACNAPTSPTAATGTMASWITSPSTLSFSLTSSTFSVTWTNGSCTISQSGTASTSGSTVTVTYTGTYTCTGTSCSTYATSVFGSNVCGATTTGTDIFTYSPSTGVSVGGSATMTQASGATNPTCASFSQSNYVRFTATRTL